MLDGNVAALELNELDDTITAASSPTFRSPTGCSPRRTSRTSPRLAPNSSAAILLFEHVWATPASATAVVDSGGELVGSFRIPKEAIDEVLAATLSPSTIPKPIRDTRETER